MKSFAPITLIPRDGLTLTYTVIARGGYHYVGVTAVDARGCRSAETGALPTAALAARLLRLLSVGAVTPYTLTEIYDEFLAAHLP